MCNEDTKYPDYWLTKVILFNVSKRRYKAANINLKYRINTKIIMFKKQILEQSFQDNQKEMLSLNKIKEM